MSFWCLQFLLKYERKQVDLRYHSSKDEFVRSFFGKNVGLKKSYGLFLTFNTENYCASTFYSRLKCWGTVICFFEDGTKLKMHSEITTPLQYSIASYQFIDSSSVAKKKHPFLEFIQLSGQLQNWKGVCNWIITIYICIFLLSWRITRFFYSYLPG